MRPTAVCVLATLFGGCRDKPDPPPPGPRGILKKPGSTPNGVKHASFDSKLPQTVIEFELLTAQRSDEGVVPVEGVNEEGAREASALLAELSQGESHDQDDFPGTRACFPTGEVMLEGVDGPVTFEFGSHTASLFIGKSADKSKSYSIQVFRHSSRAAKTKRIQALLAKYIPPDMVVKHMKISAGMAFESQCSKFLVVEEGAGQAMSMVTVSNIEASTVKALFKRTLRILAELNRLGLAMRSSLYGDFLWQGRKVETLKLVAFDDLYSFVTFDPVSGAVMHKPTNKCKWKNLWIPSCYSALVGVESSRQYLLDQCRECGDDVSAVKEAIEHLGFSSPIDYAYLVSLIK